MYGKIKSVFIDLDDTLLDFRRSEDAAVREALSGMGIAATDGIAARYSALNAEQWKLLEEGKTTRPRMLVDRFRNLFAEMKCSADPAEANERYKASLARQVFFVPGAIALLETLSTRCDLYLASNGTASVQDGRIKRAGIGGYFRDIFVSQRVGFDKPARGFFDACFALSGARAESSVMIGDSLSSDIRGGADAGMRTVWFNPRRLPEPDDPKPDFTVTALSEVPAALAACGKS